MARSTKGSGNPLLPIAIIAVVVLAIIVGVFALGGEETLPDQPTIVADDAVDDTVEGEVAGSLPDGEPVGEVNDTELGADELEEGITDQVDDVEPAAEGVDSVPAAERVDSSVSDVEGETDADEQVADAVNEGPGEEQDADRLSVGTTTIDASEAGGADGEAARLREPEEQTAPEQPSIDEETVGTDEAENVDTPGPQDGTAARVLPAGRDAQTNLDPSECQDIVRNTDSGGAAFIPTPSGPDANTRGECLDSAQ